MRTFRKLEKLESRQLLSGAMSDTLENYADGDAFDEDTLDDDKLTFSLLMWYGVENLASCIKQLMIQGAKMGVDVFGQVLSFIGNQLCWIDDALIHVDLGRFRFKTFHQRVEDLNDIDGDGMEFIGRGLQLAGGILQGAADV